MSIFVTNNSFGELLNNLSTIIFTQKRFIESFQCAFFNQNSKPLEIKDIYLLMIEVYNEIFS